MFSILFVLPVGADCWAALQAWANFSGDMWLGGSQNMNVVTSEMWSEGRVEDGSAISALRFSMESTSETARAPGEENDIVGNKRKAIVIEEQD